ncbi:histidine phosphatase family protein [soil metagenome]
MRHAKSSWDDANLPDFDRPLNTRGQQAAPFMGMVMDQLGLAPDVIVCSPAVRAEQTAVFVKEAGKLRGILHFEPRIYEASPNTLRQVVAEIADSNSSAMIVGHNPGVEGFIRYLTGELESMPTAALAVIELEIDKWGDVNDGSGKLMTVIRPKDMMK